MYQGHFATWAMVLSTVNIQHVMSKKKAQTSRIKPVPEKLGQFIELVNLLAPDFEPTVTDADNILPRNRQPGGVDTAHVIQVANTIREETQTWAKELRDFLGVDKK